MASRFIITVQVADTSDDNIVYFTNEEPTFFGQDIPVVGGEDTARVVFLKFKPTNGGMLVQGKNTIIPLDRIVQISEEN